MFRRYGPRVTIVQRGARLLPGEDPEISAAVTDGFNADGIDLLVDTECVAVRGRAGHVQVDCADGSTLTGSHLLIAAGRVPNSDRLGVEHLGLDLDLDLDGFIPVDDGLHTTADDVWVIGDLRGGPMFTHTARDDADIVYRSVFKGATRSPMTATAATHSPLRRALQRRGFRSLFAAQTISRWGDTFNSVALVILVYQLTGSGVRVAGVVAFEIVPVVLLGFVAGSVVDRSSRRRVMIGADLGRALVASGLVLFHEELAVVYLSAFLLSAFSVFFNPAAASALPDLVADDEIVGANSAVWSGAVISQIALAPMAGALVALAGPGPAFGINAVSFLVSAALLRGLPIGARPARAATRHLSDIAEGLRTITASRFLGTLAGVQGLAALSAGATSALLVVLAEEHLDIGAGKSVCCSGRSASAPASDPWSRSGSLSMCVDRPCCSARTCCAASWTSCLRRSRASGSPWERWRSTGSGPARATSPTTPCCR